jgi:cathepsin D
VNLDTGSSDLFLPSTACDDGSCNGHTLYDPSQSSTQDDLGTPFDLEYEDYSDVKGTLYTDAVTIAGYTVSLCDLLMFSDH